MPLWGTTNNAVYVNATSTKEITNGAPIGTSWTIKNGGEVPATRADGANAHFGNTSTGSRAAVDYTMFGNTTVGAFIPGKAVGVVSVNPAETLVSGNADYVTHAGWVLRTLGTGGIATGSVTTQAAQMFANGETITASNGTANGTLHVVTNATGNVVSLVVDAPGAGWKKAADVAYTWNHNIQWMANVTVAVQANAYTNGNYLIVSNGVVNAVMNLSTNSIGGLTNASFVNVNIGLFPSSTANASLVLTVSNTYPGATGALGNTVTTSFLMWRANSSLTDTVSVTLGGRAGRQHCETLVAVGSITGASVNGIFPES